MALLFRNDVTVTGRLTLGLNSIGQVYFANNTNLFKIGFLSGVATSSINYLLPTVAPTLSSSFLLSNTSGVMSWSSATTVPTFAGIVLNGTGSVNINANSVSINAIEDITSDVTGVFQTLLESHENSSLPPILSMLKSRGTRASPTAVVINDAIGFHNFYGYTGNSSVGYQQAVQVQYWICQDGTTVSTTSMPGRFQVFTTPDLSVTPVERLRINCTGTISLFGNLQMDGNKIYGDTGASGTLILSANSSANLNYLVLGDATNRIDVFAGQPAITATQTVVNYSPTFTISPGGINVNHASYSSTPTITVAAGGGTVSGVQGIVLSENITHNSSLACVYTAVQCQPTITSTANAGFASSFSLFNGNPTLASSTAGVYPFPINGMLAATPTYNAGNVNVSSSASTFDIAIRHTPTYNTTGASSKMTFLSKGLSTGLVLNANTAGAGNVLTCTSRVGLEWRAVTFTATGNITLTDNVGVDLLDQSASTGNFTSTNVYGIRSAITSGTSRFFLYHSGTADSAHTGNLRLGDTTAPTALLDLAGKLTANSSGFVSKYNNVTTSTSGWGVPAIYGAGRFTAQTAAKASVAAYTVGAADGSFYVSANVLVTTSTVHSFTVTCAYTDEGGTARTLTFTFSNVGGTLLTAIANAGGAVPYEGIPLHIRAKAATSITIATTGTFTTVTYNVEGSITQIA